MTNKTAMISSDGTLLYVADGCVETFLRSGYKLAKTSLSAEKKPNSKNKTSEKAGEE